jgi:hypothetical protein
VPEEDPLAKEIPTEVKNFAARLNEWRTTGDRGRAIPAAFWQEAGQLAGKWGPGKVARASGLNHIHVKARMAVQVPIRGRAQTTQEEPLDRSSSRKSSPFVEISMNTARPISSPMVVELRNSQGGFLCVEQGSSADIVMLMHAFLGRSA